VVRPYAQIAVDSFERGLMDRQPDVTG